MRELQPKDIHSTSTAIEFVLQEMRKMNGEIAAMRQRLNVLEDNDQTLNERTKTLHNRYESNYDRYDRKIADLRTAVEKLKGVHGA